MSKLQGIGILLCVCMAAVAIQPVVADVMPAKYRLEPFARGMTNPEAVAMSPDGRIFVGERVSGEVRLIDDGVLQATPFVTLPVATNAGTTETGLLGIALHPNFVDNGWIYLFYTHDLGGGTNTNRIVRYTAVGNIGTDETVILDSIGSGPNGEDNGGALIFGPDGKLYATVGVMEDDSSAASFSSLGGKVLRMNADGSTPADNPQTALSPPYDLIWAWGFRNPAGIAFNDVGTLYVSDNTDDEVGVDCDEINVVLENVDYGWDSIYCGTQGYPPAPMQVITPKTTAWDIAPYSGTAFPGSCSNNAGIECSVADDCKACDHNNVPCADDAGCSTCSNFPGQECTSDNDCLACADDPGYACSVDSDCTVCSKDPTVRCRYDFECPSGGSRCNVPISCATNTCDIGTCLTNPCSDPSEYMFVAGKSSGIMRDSLAGTALDELAGTGDFYTPAGVCPSTITNVAVGKDGWIYATAAGTDPGLYRVVYDGTGYAKAAPRETSGSAYTPLTLGKNGSGIDFMWEDLKKDAWPCSEGRKYCTGDEYLTYCDSYLDCFSGPCEARPCPAGSGAGKYTLWSGTLASPLVYDHTVLVETNAADFGDALVLHTEASMPPGDTYFLVSARGANLEGTTGFDSDGVERPGYSVTDKCDDIGYGNRTADYELCFGDLPKSYADQNNRWWTMDDLRGKTLIFSMMQYG